MLKPDMFATISLQTSRTINAVVVPSEAIVRTGTREQVFVQRQPGKFEPRAVELGLQAGGLVQIVSGIKAGERVVTSSQFLIDSESKLKEATAKMLDVSKSKPETTEAQRHKGKQDEMNMEGMQMHHHSAPAPTIENQTPLKSTPMNHEGHDMGGMQMRPDQHQMPKEHNHDNH